MVYKELKEKPNEPKPVQPNVRVAYAEIVSALLITAMFCGTLLVMMSMMTSCDEHQVYLRGASP